jgi:hypothetical protein
VSLEKESKIAAALLRAQAVPCSIFSDDQSCDNHGQPLPCEVGWSNCGIVALLWDSDWRVLYKRAADYRFLAAHRTSEHRTYSQLARDYESMAQKAVFNALIDVGDVPDLGYWRARGKADACTGQDECFARDATGIVRAKGSFADEWSEGFEHVAGEAYLIGYWDASDDEGT